MKTKFIFTNTFYLFSIAVTAQAFAAPADLMEGAQTIPAHNSGSIVIPASSIPPSGAEGLAMHTNARFYLSEKTAVSRYAVSGPPVQSLNFETPASLACVYGLAPAKNTCNPNSVTAVAAGGSRAIAIVDAYNYPNALADLKLFSAQFGLPAPTATSFQVVYASGRQPPGNAGWEMEMALDIEMAHAMAPKALIYLVEAASASTSDLLAAVDKAASLVSAAGGGQVSMSWGGPEFSGESSLDTHFTKTGVTFFASAGDAPGVSWPSASANVVSVGGTSLARQLGTFALIHHASWVEGGGGISSYVARPPYQSNVALTVGSYRGVPDIAAVADPNTGVWIYDSGNGGWLVAGGTSVASPLVAGIVNASGHFYSSSAMQLAAIYQKSLSAGSFTPGATGYCGPQAAFTVTPAWNLCLGVGSPSGLLSQ